MPSAGYSNYHSVSSVATHDKKLYQVKTINLFYINPKEYRKERKKLLAKNTGWKEFMGYMFLQVFLQPQPQRGVPASFFYISVDTAIK